MFVLICNNCGSRSHIGLGETKKIVGVDDVYYITPIEQDGPIQIKVYWNKWKFEIVCEKCGTRIENGHLFRLSDVLLDEVNFRR